jgi:glycosyltransferase involved in cell wall biosynthesis
VDALAVGLRARGWTVRVEVVSRGPGAAWVIRAAARGCDVVHAHGQRAGWWAALGLRTRPRRPPLVVTIHNIVLDEVAGPWASSLRRMERALPHCVDAVIATSPAAAATVGRARAVVAPFGPRPVPARCGERVRAEYGIAPDAPLAVAVGRLHPQKGFDVLLDAVPEISRRVPAARVLIVGDGPLGAHLRARAVADGLGAVVRFGASTTDSAGVLAAADAVVVPSLWESGPLILTEALAIGRPVVTTPVGFALELVDGETTGLLVPVGDAAALAAATADLLGDRQRARAIGCAGQRRVDEWLDPGAAVDAIAAVYDEVRR